MRGASYGAQWERVTKIGYKEEEKTVLVEGLSAVVEPRPEPPGFRGR